MRAATITLALCLMGATPHAARAAVFEVGPGGVLADRTSGQSLIDVPAVGTDQGGQEPEPAPDIGVDLATVQSAIAASRSKLETVKASRAADARRAAVLEGLAGLGYEVTEGMSTSWAHDGHVVVRRAATPDYGVELSGNPDGGRLQMRAVAFDDESAAHDVKRHVDAETIWCGDVGKLGSRLAVLGGGLVIEKARPVGAVPLKRVPRAGRDLDRTSREGASAKTRSLD